ncbi:hypothetical protein [Lysobacter silvisoli]|uniref:VCBS repeat-containing protein n=1 Tax=Lysobacter silvisoli TaxID=2293254 RepID=A0A371JXF5_9GAMM|nr:hypothetical protein [Lysobacter silvisoli]RDZ26341.1 hypothetical protein DX914_15150 [Lysobacter silvisoli]
MGTTRLQVALALGLALGLHAHSASAEQYDPPIAIGSIACPAGSTGYGNARFIVFPSWASAPPNWRLTIWCNAAGAGRRTHFEPGGGGVFAPWPNLGGAFGVGWPPPPSYGNQFQQLDVDSDGDLDVLQLLETAPNTWTVFLNRAL